MLVRPPSEVVCLDTCHLDADGYDMTFRRGYERVMAESDRTVGPGRVQCFHLNDCQETLGRRVDRHGEIGKGTVGLGAFRQLVGVLETPALLQSLVRR